MALPTTSTPLSTGHTTAHDGVYDVKAHFGAAGDGTTDDTAAFDAAATAAGWGGTIYVPPGIFRIKDWAPSVATHIKGAGNQVNGGPGGTVLMAAPGATWMIKFLGKFDCSIDDLQINGNARASSGVLCQGQIGATSQGMRFTNVSWIRCITAVEFDATTIETDKNHLLNCRMDECLKGVRIHGDNSQFTVLDNVYIGADVGVHMSGGTLWWRTGGEYNSVLATGATGILIDSFSSIAYILLQDLIMGDDFLGSTSCNVDGTNGWPTDGITIERCILQSQVGVHIGGSSSKLTLRNMRFNNGGIRVHGDSSTVHEEYVIYVAGATYAIAGGTNNARFVLENTNSVRYLQINGNPADPYGTKYGIAWGDHDNGAMDTNLYRNKANQLKTDDKFLADLGLGVGNSAAATEVIGKAVVKKIQVFDASGVSIGYIPVYSSIT